MWEHNGAHRKLEKLVCQAEHQLQPPAAQLSVTMSLATCHSLMPPKLRVTNLFCMIPFQCEGMRRKMKEREGKGRKESINFPDPKL